MSWMCIRIASRGDSNTHPQHMILWRYIKIITFYQMDSDPRFPPFYYSIGANLGSLLHGDVSVMFSLQDMVLIVYPKMCCKKSENRLTNQIKKNSAQKEF